MSHRAKLETLCTGFALQPAGFLLGGRTYANPHPSGMSGDGVFGGLSTVLYREVYSNSGDVPLAPSSVQSRTAFLAELSRGNQTEELVDPGWVVQSVSLQGTVTAIRSGVTRTLAPGQYRSATTPQANQSVARISLRDETGSNSGFYYAYSEADFEYTPTVLRFYWNIPPAGAAPLVRAVTHQLNRYRVPFIFKCLDDPGNYTRRDAAVLFVKRQYLHVCIEVLPRIYSAVAGWLRKDVPFLTLRLANGLGFAENPPGLTSFGLHRMQLLAGGLLQDGGPGTDSATRARNLMRYFAAHGIDLDQPFLNPRSDAGYIEDLQSCTAGIAA